MFSSEHDKHVLSVSIALKRCSQNCCEDNNAVLRHVQKRAMCCFPENNLEETKTLVRSEKLVNKIWRCRPVVQKLSDAVASCVFCFPVASSRTLLVGLALFWKLLRANFCWPCGNFLCSWLQLDLDVAGLQQSNSTHLSFICCYALNVGGLCMEDSLDLCAMTFIFNCTESNFKKIKKY